MGRCGQLKENGPIRWLKENVIKENVTDIMDQRDDMVLPQKDQVQRLVFQANEHDDALFPIREKTFALTFKSKLNETFTTLPINFYSATGAAGGTDGLHEFILDIEEGLEELPNKVIDNVEVHGLALGHHQQTAR